MDDPDQNGRVLTLGRCVAWPVVRRACRRNRAGFTLVEILVGVFIVGLLTAVVSPMFVYRLKTSRAEAITSEMQNLQSALQLFYNDVGRYPARLDYLDVIPTVGSVNDACGVAIPATLQAKFRGPYINRQIDMIAPFAGTPNTKYAIATDDTIEATIQRGTVTDSTALPAHQVLQIFVNGLPQDITILVDSTVDGKVDGNMGIVRYATPTATNNLIKWTIPIKAGAC